MDIKPYNEKYKDQMISVWESSVRATHHFVKPDDIDYFKQLVKGIDFSTFSVHCLISDNQVLGFISAASFFHFNGRYK
jgi:putative acetyltransferase